MFKLSTRSRYGIRAMIELATAKDAQPLEMSAIAQRQRLSRKYLHALLVALKDAGLTESVRGVNGGYRLTRSPEQIGVKEILEALEGPVAVVDCAHGEAPCAHEAECGAAPLWQHLNSAIEEVLQGISLADLLQRKPLRVHIERTTEEESP
ncbi:MAG: Rrf2 family transcriptional regulator [Proteobacteria bacterium]|nr:Rrf2 family transcriptional regulator [Pseudomonadota bacterium]